MLGSQDPDVYFYGRTIEKIGRRKYKITKGGFTTCLQPTKIRLNVADIVKKLRGTGQEPLEMAYDENTRKLNMVIKGRWKTTFTLPTLDPGDEEVPTPKIAFNTKIKMISSSFKDIIDQMRIAIPEEVKKAKQLLKS
jgi:hypothetical protein